MPEISNKTLAVLLVVAIVISVGGAMLTITQVTNLINIFPALQGITGLGTTGRVNVTIATVAQLNVAQPTAVNFDIGYVTAGQTSATLNSSEGIPSAWTTQGTYAPKDFGIVNSGTVDIFVNVSSNAIGSTMIGGGAGGIPDPTIQFESTNNQSGSCGRALGNLTTFATADAAYEVCKNLSYFAGTQSVNISIVLVVPQDAAAGNKTALLTFTATQCSA